MNRHLWLFRASGNLMMGDHNRGPGRGTVSLFWQIDTRSLTFATFWQMSLTFDTFCQNSLTFDTFCQNSLTVPWPESSPVIGAEISTIVVHNFILSCNTCMIYSSMSELYAISRRIWRDATSDQIYNRLFSAPIYSMCPIKCILLVLRCNLSPTSSYNSFSFAHPIRVLSRYLVACGIFSIGFRMK